MDIITEIMECFQKTTKEQSGLANTDILDNREPCKISHS